MKSKIAADLRIQDDDQFSIVESLTEHGCRFIDEYILSDEVSCSWARIDGKRRGAITAIARDLGLEVA